MNGSQDTARNPSCRVHFFVRPHDDPEWVRGEVRRLGLHGLKCYHTFAPVQPTWEAEIPDFLPEPLVRVANDEGWFITLHMVCASCLRRSIQHLLDSPVLPAVSPHAVDLGPLARGFQPAHNLEGLPQLTDLDNLYFDTSANCEPIAHQAVLRRFGSKRLMYGSDLPVSHLRGRSVAAADSFFFVEDDLPVWNAKQLKIEPVLLGLEHLRSLKWACWSERLDDEAIEDIFWNNAGTSL